MSKKKGYFNYFVNSLVNDILAGGGNNRAKLDYKKKKELLGMNDTEILMSEMNKRDRQRNNNDASWKHTYDHLERWRDGPYRNDKKK